MADTIRFLVERGIPVMAHVGLTPQASQVMGGFTTQGRDGDDRDRIEADAQAVARAGAFAVVLEGMVEPLARRITAAVPVPTIGIGASADCDGQILVLEDMLGFTDTPAKLVKRYAHLGADIREAVNSYAEALRTRRFPSLDHTYR
jgi:3-methyl-2-oxobutanoate hydroxymethyltransferase